MRQFLIGETNAEPAAAAEGDADVDADARVEAEAEREGVTVYFVRHGTTFYNLEGRWQGQLDTDLAPQGEKEAKMESDAFLSKNVRFDAAYCSDLQRAHKTALILCDPHGIVPMPTDRLREPHLGVLKSLLRVSHS